MTDVGPTDVNPPENEFICTIPPDTDAQARAALQEAYAFKPNPDPTFDAFAAVILEQTGAKFTGINWVGPTLHQVFVGAALRGGAPVPPELRVMPGHQGFCTTMITQRKNRALGLQDLLSDPRYAFNEVVEEASEANPGGLGLRSYLGAPLLPPEGVAIGSIFAVDDQEREDWKMPIVQWMKDFASGTVMPYIIDQRDRLRRGQ